MAGYWQSSFLRVDGRDRVEVRKYAEKRTRAISSHLDQISLVDKGFIILKKNTFFLAGHSSCYRIANHSARFSSSCPLVGLAL